MPRLAIKRLQIENWMRINSADIDFPEKGLVVVTGENSASRGTFDNVGAGKTSIGEALCRVLLNVHGRFTKLGECATDEQGGLKLSLEAVLDGKPLLIEQGFKHKTMSRTGEALRYRYGSDELKERGHIADTREELTKLIGVSPELARWTVFIDGDQIKFNRLSEQESVELLMSARSQPPWKTWHKNSRKVLDHFEKSALDARSTHALVSSQVEDIKRSITLAEKDVESKRQDVEQAKERNAVKIAAIDAKIQRHDKVIDDNNRRIDEIKLEIKEIEQQSAEEYKKHELEKHKLEADLAIARDKRDAQLSRVVSVEGSIRQESKILDKMESVPKECPTCKKPWDARHSKDELQKQEDIIDKLKSKLKLETDKKLEIDDTIKKLTRSHSAVVDLLTKTNVQASVKKLSHECQRLSEAIEESFRTVRELEQSKQAISISQQESALDAAIAVYQERTTKLTEAQRALQDAAKGLTETKSAVGVVRYWVDAFSPTGIPNMVLQDSIEPLNLISRKVSNIMTGGSIEVSYGTTRELASGQERAELVINVNNKLGSKKFAGSSKGEGGLTNLIIAETLAEIGNISSKIGFRWYDEVLKNQDVKVIKAVLGYLKSLANTQGILIFVVDHSNNEAFNYADHVLHVRKEASGSFISWKS